MTLKQAMFVRLGPRHRIEYLAKTKRVGVFECHKYRIRPNSLPFLNWIKKLDKRHKIFTNSLQFTKYLKKIYTVTMVTRQKTHPVCKRNQIQKPLL